MDLPKKAKLVAERVEAEATKADVQSQYASSTFTAIWYSNTG
ncbi:MULTISPECIES: hypothetical protein [unclassified Mesorhizobium]|nr:MULTISPECIES: hypothetical protein [unclassified Mesorhizobium]ESZ24263.1 hypothetical protein X734_23575 [Mesorhizobium sp. L2C084A000]